MVASPPASISISAPIIFEAMEWVLSAWVFYVTRFIEKRGRIKAVIILDESGDLGTLCIKS